MQDILGDLTADDFPAAFEKNMVAFWSPYGRANDCYLHNDNNLVWLYTGIPFPLFNGVVFANTSEAEVHAVREKLAEKIKIQGAPALWWISPWTLPNNISTLLEQNGLTPAGEVPGMVMELSLLPREPEPIEHFSLRKVNSPELQALWAQIAATGTGFSEEAIEQMIKVESTITDPQYQSQQRYIGYLEDVPVATSALVLDAGVAGIYAVATLPEARQKGIGRMMTMMPLLEAREMGYRLGVLQSSSAGYSVYQKLGFQALWKYSLYLQS
jgi:ribosomal protein S18 acetylase RimI-like enzyme